MKTYFLTIFSLFILYYSASASSCNVGTIVLNNQAGVNSLPACDTIIGFVTIDGLGINDLSPLSQWQIFKGKLYIQNTSLSTLNGLNILKSVDTLPIENNTLLTNLNDLSSFKFTKVFRIVNNALLTDLTGLSSLTKVNTYMEVKNNPSLTTFGFPPNIDTLSLDLNNNILLQDLLGLESVTYSNSFNCNGNVALNNLNLNSLNFAAFLVVQNSALVSLNIPSLDSVDFIAITENNLLTNVQLPNLVKTEFLSLSSCFLLNSISVPQLHCPELNFFLSNLPMLTSLGGLSNSMPYSGNLWLENTGLTNLTGLHNFTYSTGLIIQNNVFLTTLNDLTGLKNIYNSFHISNNPALNLCCRIAEVLKGSGNYIDNIFVNNNGQPCISFVNIMTGCIDIDGDNMIISDNCPTVSNINQADFDGDAVGDECDVCPFNSDPSQTDTNSDGIGDACQNVSGPVGARAEVIDGDVYISNVNRGVIMKSTNGNCYRLKVDAQGKVKSLLVPCPI